MTDSTHVIFTDYPPDLAWLFDLRVFSVMRPSRGASWRQNLAIMALAFSSVSVRAFRAGALGVKVSSYDIDLYPYGDELDCVPSLSSAWCDATHVGMQSSTAFHAYLGGAAGGRVGLTRRGGKRTGGRPWYLGLSLSHLVHFKPFDGCDGVQKGRGVIRIACGDDGRCGAAHDGNPAVLRGQCRI